MAYYGRDFGMGLGRTGICPECGKHFIIPPENVYKIFTGTVVKHYCSYSCFRKEQKRREPKKTVVEY